MRAIVFDRPGRPLRAEHRPVPTPGEGQLLLKVSACGVCRTDLHLLDGEVTVADPPRVLGHQIVGVIETVGPAPAGIACSQTADSPTGPPPAVGERVGVPWLGWTCGECEW